MKKMLILCSILTLLATFSFAQTTLDDFEGAFAGWTGTAGWPTPLQITTDGANSTAQCMEVQDGGYSATVEKTFTGIVPENGDYKVTFYYKNGDQAGKNPLGATGFLRVKINDDSLSQIELSTSVVSTWTAAVTGFVTGLTAGSDIKVTITAQSNATANCEARFDEFVLVKETPPVSATVSPRTGYILSSIQTLTVSPNGGSGTYTSVAFDVDDDGSVEYTDSTPGDGFTFDFDTVAYTTTAGNDRVDDVAIKVTVTDDTAATGDITPVYDIDNRAAGRKENIVNGGFETWAGTYPDGWYFFDADQNGAQNTVSNIAVEKETTDPFAGANALKVTFTLDDYTYRYSMRSEGFSPNSEEFILWFRGKGGEDVRMYYFTSNNGTTWVTTAHGVFSDSSASAWNEGQDAPWSPNSGALYFCVATHKFINGAGWWDEVSVTSSTYKPLLSADTMWDLYK